MVGWDALKGAAKEAKEEAKSKTSEDYYLLGVQAYANEDFTAAINYFKKALELDPKNKKAEDYLKRAQQKLEGIPKVKERSEIYLKGVEAYKDGNYDVAAACFHLALASDGEMAQKNLEKAEKQGGNVDVGMAALRLQNLPKPLMQMVIAYYQKPSTGVKAPAPVEEKKKEPTLFASIEGYDIRVDNKNIDRKTAIGKTNLDSYVIKEEFEKGAEKTDWEKMITSMITSKYKGAYIGALLDKQNRTTGVFYLANGSVYFLTWEMGGLSGDYVLHNGKWLKFKTTKLDGNGEQGIYVGKKEEAPALTKLKKDFEEAGFV